jgi:O-antigen/teichoic acid export membrane protein
MRSRQLLINSVYYTVGEVLPRIIGFFLLPVLTRWLTPAEYGINSYTTTVMLFSFAIGSLTLNTFLLRNYYKAEGPDAQRGIIGNIFLMMLLSNGLVTGLELLLFPPALDWLKIRIPFRPFFLLAILNNFMEGLSIVPLVIFRIRKNAKLFVLINATKTFFQFAVTFFLLTRLHAGLKGVYMARIYVNIPYSLLFLAIIYRFALFKPDLAQMKKALLFSLPVLPGVLSYLFIATFDRIVLEKNLGLTSLGLYASAATLSLALNVIVQGLYRAFEQKIFEKHGTPGYADVTDTLYRYFLTCLLTGGFLLSIFSREVFLLFTSRQFLEAYRLVPLLVVPVILSGLTTYLATMVLADHRQTVITRATAVSVVVTIVGTVALVRVIGVYGAILTSAVSFALVLYFYLRNVELKNNYVVYLVILLVILLGVSLGVTALDLPLGWSILVKGVMGLLYCWLCVRIFHIRLDRLEL